MIYMSLSVQITAIVLVLGFSGRLAWLRVYTLAFIFAALGCIAISALMPSEGVWMFEGLKHGDPLLPVSSGAWPVYAALRDGSLRLLMARGAEGIITFPSLHAGLAVILIVALWPVPVLRWISAVINSLMLVATPIDGAHYLTDILAGVVIAVVSLLAARALVARLGGRPATASIALVAGTENARPDYGPAQNVPAE
jgi:membrane-associated phospholipid phosphatase